VKPGPRDTAYSILITGSELAELKKLTWLMAETYGLERRIEMYQGKRPITLYAWDPDALENIILDAVAGSPEYQDRSGPGYEALQRLSDRLKGLRE
jgi:hypothetical protein